MVQVVLSFLILFFGANVLAGTAYYDELVLGEHNVPNYEGHLKPFPYYSQYQSGIRFKDEDLFHAEIYKIFNSEIQSIQSFLNQDFLTSSYCSNQELSENVHYLRYLFRLLALSYTYENLVHYEETLRSMGIKNHYCFQQNQNILKQCNPKSLEMKKFKKRSEKVLEQYKFYLPQSHSYKKFTEDWIESYVKRKFDTPSLLRVSLVKNNDQKLSLDDIQNDFTKICQEDSSFFNLLCNEQDQLFGISQALIGKELILASNARNVLNSTGKALECTERFINQSIEKENHYKSFEKLFFPTFTYLNQTLPARFIQGRLFLPGALKEFDDKGLKEFLFAEEKATPTPIPTPKIVVNIIKEEVKVIEKKVEPKPIVTATPTPVATVDTRSAFYLASIELKNSSNTKIKVDMQKFRQDYVFTPEIKKKVENIFNTYKTRQALEDLKEFDKLGTKDEPVRLLFLKFLIDQNEHQGLFNVKSILGDHFFVTNDLDNFPDAKKAQWVHLNFSILDGGWQLILEKEINTKKP